MDHNSKRKVAGGAIYVFCAFMLVSILSISLITALGGTQERAVNKTPVTGSASGTQSRPADTGTLPVTDGGVEEPPATGETAASGQVSDPVSALPYSYYMPINGYISKGYSTELAVYSAPMTDYRAHCGIDIEAPRGTAVSSFADGTVETIWNDQFMGACMCISHDGGMKSYYMNLSGEYPAGIEEGARVVCGQPVASVGNTAALEASDTSHLHFEVTVDGKHVDPLGYLDYNPLAVQDYED